MSQARLLQVVGSLLNGGAFSDLRIKTRNEVIHVHKAILCPQAKYFELAVKDGQFMEGQDGLIDWSDDDPAAVRAVLQYLYTGEYDFFGELDGAEDATEMLLHVDVFLITERIQIDHIPELAITKLTAAMRTASLFQLTTIMKVAYEHGIPSSAKGELLKSAFLQEAVPKSHALSELTAFNELLGEGGAFAQDFVKGLCNVHPKSTENGRLATAMGVRCEICYCPSCHYNWLNPSKAVRTDNKCPICTNSARVRVSAQVRLWKCSAASCTGAFFGAAPSGSQTYICPSCKKACLAVRPE